jgi:L-rhamnose-H+ transport protein
MDMHLFYACVLVLVAGVINGSFALPTKIMKRWKFENIWLNYSLWTFLILPWTFFFLFDPHALHVYALVPTHLLWIVIIGGFLFGVGQAGFVIALDSIGLGLGFLINIALGTGLGFLLPLVFLHTKEVFTSFGAATLVGTAFILCGVLTSFIAGKRRDIRQQKEREEAHLKPVKTISYAVGVACAIMAGLFSAGQNFTFAATAQMQQIALHAGVSHLGASVIIWPLFLLASVLPFAGYMLFLLGKHKTFRCYAQKISWGYLCWTFLMGLFWYSSLILYSESSLLIGRLGPIVAWPLFMVLIILSSNFWGWCSGEWKGCHVKTIRFAQIGILLLIVSVIILAYSVALSH